VKTAKEWVFIAPKKSICWQSGKGQNCPSGQPANGHN